MSLQAFLQPCLPSYDLTQLNVKRDKILIITSILNQGNFRALQWLTRSYAKKEIEKVIKHPVRGMWYEWILKYWLKIFGAKLPNQRYKQAVIKL